MAQAALDGNDGKYFRNYSLGNAEIQNLFNTSQTAAEIPFRPSGGDLFVYKNADLLKQNDWKADGHMWANQGNKKPLPRSNPKYLKSYYYIKADGKANKNFKKEVYFPPDNSTQVCIIHYLGNSDLSEPVAHGNAKKSQPFFRTKPSVLKDIEVKTDIEKAHKVYKDLVCENTSGHDAVSKPRNVKQLHNVRAAKQQDIRLSRDAIYNTHEIAYEGGFVHFLSTFPDLCIVVGENEVIEELKQLIQTRDDNFHLSYDTTFSLGEFYVSPLVFKHTMFEENPLIAGLFLIHERKLTETHDVFFRKLCSLVGNLKNVPIVTDMESAIVRAIKNQTPMKQLGCWRHLRQDVQRWLSDNLPKVERSTYINDLYEILRASNEHECNSIISAKKQTWHGDFVKYFDRTIEHKLPYFCMWSIRGSCRIDPQNGITTNQSEGFNFLLKDFQNWKEVPLDCLLMSLKLIQGFYLEEIRRGKAGLGTYTLKRNFITEYSTDINNFRSRQLTCHPKDIVSSLRDKEFKQSPFSLDLDIQIDENSTNSRILRAKQLVASDNISFSPKLGFFTVRDQSSLQTVQLFPSELCSCPIKKNCFHILAVKMGQRMEINDKDMVNQNLGVIRKNTQTSF